MISNFYTQRPLVRFTIDWKTVTDNKLRGSLFDEIFVQNHSAYELDVTYSNPYGKTIVYVPAGKAEAFTAFLDSLIGKETCPYCIKGQPAICVAPEGHCPYQEMQPTTGGRHMGICKKHQAEAEKESRIATNRQALGLDF